MHEPVPHHLPRQCLMLHGGVAGAVNDVVVLGVNQQHPHDGGFRDISVEPILHPPVGGGIQQVGVEARPVVVIGRQQALALKLLRQMDRRPRRQIPALGVATDAVGTVLAGPDHLLSVLRGTGLCRHRLQIAHVEVLLPAHQTGIRPPIGDEHAAVRQQEGHGGKLHLLRLVIAALKGEQPGIPEPLRLRRRPHHRDIVQRRQAQLFIRRRQPGAYVPDGHGVLGVLAPQAVDLPKVDVGDDAQHQIVHLIEGVLLQRQISSPLEIVANRIFVLSGHSFPPARIIVQDKVYHTPSPGASRRMTCLFPAAVV